MAVFTFHLPAFTHDAVAVQADTVEEAREALCEAIEDGSLRVIEYDIDDDRSGRYDATDAFECPVAFNSEGEVINK